MLELELVLVSVLVNVIVIVYSGRGRGRGRDCDCDCDRGASWPGRILRKLYVTSTVIHLDVSRHLLLSRNRASNPMECPVRMTIDKCLQYKRSDARRVIETAEGVSHVPLKRQKGGVAVLGSIRVIRERQILSIHVS